MLIPKINAVEFLGSEQGCERHFLVSEASYLSAQRTYAKLGERSFSDSTMLQQFAACESEHCSSIPPSTPTPTQRTAPATTYAQTDTAPNPLEEKPLSAVVEAGKVLGDGSLYSLKLTFKVS